MLGGVDQLMLGSEDRALGGEDQVLEGTDKVFDSEEEKQMRMWKEPADGFMSEKKDPA